LSAKLISMNRNTRTTAVQALRFCDNFSKALAGDCFTSGR
jgi:hypothetical protein